MININNYDIFLANISTLKETSADTSKSSFIEYMTNSDISVVNFDGVKKMYIKGLGINEGPKSIDALYVNNNSKIVLIEFKNGKMREEKYFDVVRKIYDSVFILSDI